MLFIWLTAGLLLLACVLAYRTGLFDALMLRVALVLLAWLALGTLAIAADTTVTSSSEATSATTTISLLPLWLQMIPYLASGVGALFVAICGAVAYKITGIQVTKDENARLQQAATNAAGRVFAQLDGPVGNLKIDVNHPLVVKEANLLMANFGDILAKFGWTPERVAGLILGKLGQMQASSASVPAVVPIAVAAATKQVTP